MGTTVFAPQRGNMGHTNTLQNFLEKLQAKGWQLLPGTWGEWWQRRLRRPSVARPHRWLREFSTCSRQIDTMTSVPCTVFGAWHFSGETFSKQGARHVKTCHAPGGLPLEIIQFICFSPCQQIILHELLICLGIAEKGLDKFPVY